MTTTPDNSSPIPPRRPRRALTVGVTIVVGVLLGLVLSAGRLAIQRANEAACANNLHEIGLAILRYQQDCGGRYPDSLQTLMATEQVTSYAFVCPASHDDAATGPTTRAVLDHLAAEQHHLSYIYLGSGLTDKTAADTAVIAYEPLANHRNHGMNILFGDGHAEFVDAAHAARLIAGALAAARPVSASGIR